MGTLGHFEGGWGWHRHVRTLGVIGLHLVAVCCFAQKKTRAEIEHAKFCSKHTHLLHDPFSQDTLIRTKFSEMFGYVENQVRVGGNIWLGASIERDTLYLLLRLKVPGQQTYVIPKGDKHQFSLGRAGGAHQFDLETSVQSDPVTALVSNAAGSDIVTTYELKYVISAQRETFLRDLFNAMRFSMAGREIIGACDNDERAQTFQNALQCVLSSADKAGHRPKTEGHLPQVSGGVRRAYAGRLPIAERVRVSGGVRRACAGRLPIAERVRDVQS